MKHNILIFSLKVLGKPKCGLTQIWFLQSSSTDSQQRYT